ncbi:MAG: DNA polymerase III subunit delta [Bacilli bacterium]
MKNFYVFYGEEEYLINQEKKKLKEKFLLHNTNFNIIEYDLKESTLDDLLDDALMPSMFSNEKLLICWNSYFLTALKETEDKSLNIERLINYIDNYQGKNTIIFIVNYEKIDTRKKIVKKLKEKALIKEFSLLKERDLITYAQDKLKKEGFKIDYSALILLISRIHQNIAILNKELEKLMLYKNDDQVITSFDVEEMIPSSFLDDVFDLVKVVIKKDLESILTIYQKLLDKNEEPVKIIVLLGNQFRLIYQTKRMQQLGYSLKEITTRLKVHPYRVQLASEIKIEQQLLLTYLERLADLDMEIKTGKIDKQIGLELFFLRL